MALTFLATLAAGMLGALSLSRPEAVAWRFIRLVAVLAILCLAAAAAWHFLGTHAGTIWGTLAAICSLGGASLAAVIVAIAALTLDQTKLIRTLAAAGGILGFLAAAIWGDTCSIWPDWNGWLTLAAIIGQALGAFLLGAVSLVLLSGYARLSTHEMPTGPLRRMSGFLLAAVAGRTAFAITCFAFLWMQADDLYVGGLAAVLSGLTLMLVVRFIVGLMLVAVLAAGVFKAVRSRAVRTATWLAFLATEFAVLGELANQYLVRATGFPM
jgi:hypothetical protein